MTQAVWYEMLKPLQYLSCREAIIEIARSGKPRPTVGEIYHMAVELEAIEVERMRNSRRALPEPPRTPEEIAKAKASFSEIIAQLSQKWGMPYEE